MEIEKTFVVKVEYYKGNPEYFLKVHQCKNRYFIESSHGVVETSQQRFKELCENMYK